ncbi:hypothetical protein Gotur_028111 [Gossypium turneri]
MMVVALINEDENIEIPEPMDTKQTDPYGK